MHHIYYNWWTHPPPPPKLTHPAVWHTHPIPAYHKEVDLYKIPAIFKNFRTDNITD